MKAMLSKSFFASVVALALTLQVNAHACITPMLGVNGTPSRNDVERPSTSSECGNVDIAKTIDTSTPVKAAVDGTFSATVTNFNAGQDGSRQVTVKVDSKGTGKSFVPGSVLKNGDLVPTSVGNQPIVASLPPGTNCTGGKSKNLCLASFTTASGFGNCVVVQQGSGASNTPGTTGGAKSASSSQTVPASSKTTSDRPSAHTSSSSAPAKETSKGQSGAMHHHHHHHHHAHSNNTSHHSGAHSNSTNDGQCPGSKGKEASSESHTPTDSKKKEQEAVVSQATQKDSSSDDRSAAGIHMGKTNCNRGIKAMNAYGTRAPRALLHLLRIREVATTSSENEPANQMWC